MAVVHSSQLCAQAGSQPPVNFPAPAPSPGAFTPDAAGEQPRPEAATGSAAAAPAAAASAVPRGRPVGAWRLVIDLPDDEERGSLRELLATHLDLARYEREGLAGGAPLDPQDLERRRYLTRGDLRRLASAAPEQARGLLATEGYLNAAVRARLEAGEPQVVRLTIDPGRRTQVRSVTLRFEGELDQRFEQRDPRAVDTVAGMRRNWGLPEGSPFRQDDWGAAKNAAIARLRAEGYPAATWSGTSARIRAEDDTASLFVLADSGPLFHFGEVRVEGLRYYSAQAVRHLQPFRAGDPYRDQTLFDYQERLQKLGAFENVSVAIDPDPAAAAATPVTVTLRELPRRQATFGVGVSANTGPRVAVELIDRHLFGLDWQAKTLVELGRDQRNLEADFTSYPLRNRHRNLVSAALTNLDAAGSTTVSERLRVGRTQDGERIERTAYMEWQRATVRDEGIVSQASSVTANYQWIWRRLDNIVLPTEGWAVSAEVALGRSFAARGSDGEREEGGVFGRERLRLAGYLPLGAQWYASARTEIGAAQARPGVGLPDTLLFRAGGDESVRGYDFRALGPTLNGAAVGGRALATGSLEVARPVSKRLAAWWIAGFVDAGDAAENWSDLHPKLGYGVGVRWRSPVGPLRLDLAYGEADRRFRLHFSVGIAF